MRERRTPRVLEPVDGRPLVAKLRRIVRRQMPIADPAVAEKIREHRAVPRHDVGRHVVVLFDDPLQSIVDRRIDRVLASARRRRENRRAALHRCTIASRQAGSRPGPSRRDRSRPSSPSSSSRPFRRTSPANSASFDDRRSGRRDVAAEIRGRRHRAGLQQGVVDRAGLQLVADTSCGNSPAGRRSARRGSADRCRTSCCRRGR